MSLESRAARAANSINRSVAATRPAAVGAITRRHRLGLVTAVSFFGLLAGASVAFATMFPGNSADEEVTAAETTIPAAETTIPSEPGPPLVAVPADGETDGEGSGEGPDGSLPEDSGQDQANVVQAEVVQAKLVQPEVVQAEAVQKRDLLATCVCKRRTYCLYGRDICSLPKHPTSLPTQYF